MCHSPQKLNSLIKLPYEVDAKVHDLSFNMILISSPLRVPTPSYPFRRNLGDQVKGRSPKKSGKGSFSEKPKIVDRGSVCIALERICCKLQYDPYLISVACS